VDMPTKKLTSSSEKLLQQYLEKLRLLRGLGTAQSLLSWDRETGMPKGASGDRGEAMAILAGFAHELFTEKEFVNVVEKLNDQRKSLQPIEARSVELVHKELLKMIKVPKEFIEETNTLFNAAHSAWLEAKQTDNFTIFAPHLEKVVENRKQYANLIDPNQDPYDVLLDDYEEGLKSEYLTDVFTQLKGGLKKLLPKILARQKDVKNPLNTNPVNHVELEKFLKTMVGTIGFDMDRGAIGKVEHPFEISISANDIRLNTRFDPEENSFTIMGMVHELGHGIYEQNIDQKYIPYGLDHGVSLGIHESQSRFLENVIGRSPEFWSYFLPLLSANVRKLSNIDRDQLVAALNHVQPTFIRTESDEVTYNLHIMLRYEIECDLLHGKVDVKHVRELWQAKSEELLGITPLTDKEGVLQDVHWAWGNFGYFPTYTLGNLNAAQLLRSFELAHPKWRQEVENGNFSSYVSWFKEKIWRHGSFHTPAELMVNATGEQTQAEYLLEYLEDKYLNS
jgi:carboxypeptidase Taq